MRTKHFCKIQGIDGFDYLNCYLKRPITANKIYKIMSEKDYERSKINKYLHFNRVDSYQDRNDGMQLILDEIGNRSSKFEFAENYSYFDFLNQMRQATYSCCFSIINNIASGVKYGSDDKSGRVCLTFDLTELMNNLKRLQTLKVNAIEQRINLAYGEIEYINWNQEQMNLDKLQNYVTYLFIKDKIEFAGEQEFRLVLLPNPKAIDTYTNFKGLHLYFDFEEAIEEGIIEKIDFFK